MTALVCVALVIALIASARNPENREAAAFTGGLFVALAFFAPLRFSPLPEALLSAALLVAGALSLFYGAKNVLNERKGRGALALVAGTNLVISAHLLQL